MPELTGVAVENPGPKLRTVAAVPTDVPSSFISTPEITPVKADPSPLKLFAVIIPLALTLTALI